MFVYCTLCLFVKIVCLYFFNFLLPLVVNKDVHKLPIEKSALPGHYAYVQILKQKENGQLRETGCS